MSEHRKPRMLIVDDEQGMLRTLRRIMLAKGFEVEVAASGEEAVGMAETCQPEVLLLDMRMPGLNGVETFRQIKPICPEAVAVFMTANSSANLSQEARDEGAIEVLSKPVDIDNLCDLITQALGLRGVLVVDDDPGFRNSLQRALTAVGFHVYTAAGPEAALEEFKRHPRCVVLLDMKLPGTSGVELLQQIRKLNHDVLAVLMTGFRELEPEMTAGLESGACCTFVKPFDVDDLVAAIKAQI